MNPDFSFEQARSTGPFHSPRRKFEQLFASTSCALSGNFLHSTSRGIVGKVANGSSSVFRASKVTHNTARSRVDIFCHRIQTWYRHLGKGIRTNPRSFPLPQLSTSTTMEFVNWRPRSDVIVRNVGNSCYLDSVLFALFGGVGQARSELGRARPKSPVG